MRLWRISNFPDLRGQGGLLASGRWHTRGRSVVYLSDHPASALLEALVHLEIDADDLPDSYQLVTVETPDDVAFEAIAIGELPRGWVQDLDTTRALGDRWLANGRTALMRVPSAIIPMASNWLLNPTHAHHAELSVADIKRLCVDPWLFGVI